MEIFILFGRYPNEKNFPVAAFVDKESALGVLEKLQGEIGVPPFLSIMTYPVIGEVCASKEDLSELYDRHWGILHNPALLERKYGRKDNEQRG